MKTKDDTVYYAAKSLVEAMTPEEREGLAMTTCSGTASVFQLSLRNLVRAVEATRPDEEVFTVIRRDRAAPSTLRFWANKAERLGASGAKCDGARMIADGWEEWQLNNTVATKVPD